jgi:hypothetical protein
MFHVKPVKKYVPAGGLTASTWIRWNQAAVSRRGWAGREGDSMFHVKPAKKYLTVHGLAASMWSLIVGGTT